ncbi:hypothetical protein BVI434_1230011 [Burkholderia vietnamiensis]|nr:hypothetical protein BVI434_1230011 [Burkholderia vietnamiensis]
MRTVQIACRRYHTDTMRHGQDIESSLTYRSICNRWAALLANILSSKHATRYAQCCRYASHPSPTNNAANR